MARFYSEIESKRGYLVHRLNDREAYATARGWDVGVQVFGHPREDEGLGEGDVFEVYATGGSNGSGPSTLVCRIERRNGGEIVVTHNIGD